MAVQLSSVQVSIAPRPRPITALMRTSAFLKKNEDLQAPLQFCETHLAEHPEQLQLAKDIFETDFRTAKTVSSFVQRQLFDVEPSELSTLSLERVRKIKAKALENLAVNFNNFADRGPGESPVWDLPFKILDEKLFPFLAPADRKAFACCKTLNFYLRESIVFGAKTVTWTHVQSCYNAREEFHKLFSSVKVLNSEEDEEGQVDATPMEETEVSKLIIRNPSLEAVDFRGVSFSTITIHAMGQICTQLREADFSGTRVTDNHVIYLTKGCQKLTSLVLNYCGDLTHRAVLRVSENLPLIETLAFAGNRHVRDEHIELLVRRCPRLKAINMSDCPELTDRALFALSKCKYLTKAIVGGNDNFTDAGVIAVGEGCKKLNFFDFNDCRRVSRETMTRFQRLVVKREDLDEDDDDEIQVAELRAVRDSDFFDGDIPTPRRLQSQKSFYGRSAMQLDLQAQPVLVQPVLVQPVLVQPVQAQQPRQGRVGPPANSQAQPGCCVIL